MSFDQFDRNSMPGCAPREQLVCRIDSGWKARFKGKTEGHLVPSRNTIGWVLFITAAAVALVAAPYLSRRLGLVADISKPDKMKGKPAPDFALESLDGKVIRLSDFRGKAVLLNFWATWCVPCKTEMPWFEQFQKQYGPQGLQVLGIDTQDSSSRPEISAFAQRVGVTYPIAVATEPVAEAYGGMQFLPFTLYIDREGRVVDRKFGLKSREEIENEIKLALGNAHVAESESLPKCFDCARTDAEQQKSSSRDR